MGPLDSQDLPRTMHPWGDQAAIPVFLLPTLFAES